MKRIALAIALLASHAFAQSPRPVEVEDILTLATVSDPEISPDGAWVAYVVTVRDFEENVDNSDVWVVGTDGGEPIRLTYHRGVDNAPRWAPDASWLGFLSDRGGESTQVYGIRPDRGEAWPITEWPTDIQSYRFSPDGSRLGLVAKPKKTEEQEALEKERGRPHVWGKAHPDDWAHLWVAPLGDGAVSEAERYSPENVFVSTFVWAPDSKRLAFAGRPSPELRTFVHGSIYVVGEADGDATQVTDMPGGEIPVAWTEEHGLIASGSGHLLGTFNRKLWSVSLSGAAPVSLTDALDENAGYVGAHDDGLLVEASSRTGRGLVHVGTGVEPIDLGTSFQSAISATRDGSMVAYLAESGSDPPNVFVASTIAPEPKRLTNVNAHVDELAFGEQRVVEWSSRADGESIEGVLTLPVGYREGDRVPLLLVIHGGPSGVSSDRFSMRRSAYPIQVFAGKGYAVLQPNYRGSTGYGERFRGLNRGDISGKDWIDIDSGVDAMIERGIADAERLGIMGWSFGGHHTFWGITQTDRYKAASAGAGANDLISMYSQTDLPEFYHTYLGPKPWEDFELYEERSAYRHVTNVVTPLLIQVGEKDERVPAEQSIQFYEAVRAIGDVETELVIYPGQPHGVRDPRLLRDLMTRNVEWFTRLIPVAAAAGTTSQLP